MLPVLPHGEHCCHLLVSAPPHIHIELEVVCSLCDQALAAAPLLTAYLLGLAPLSFLIGLWYLSWLGSYCFSLQHSRTAAFQLTTAHIQVPRSQDFCHAVMQSFTLSSCKALLPLIPGGKVSRTPLPYSMMVFEFLHCTEECTTPFEESWAS